MLDCLTAVFGRWPSVDIDVEPIDHLRWKLHSDSRAVPYHSLATVNERVVGCMVTVFQAYKLRDQIASAFLLTDLAVHPDYRGQGMLSELWITGKPEYAAVIDLAVGVSRNPLVGQRSKRVGDERFANAIDVLECPLPSPLAGEDAPMIRTVSRFDTRIDGLWERASEAFSLMLVRREPYMNWRYADPRAGRFTIRLAEDGRKLLGYAVLGRSGGKAYIADLLTLPQRDDVLRALVLDAVRHFGERGETTVRCWTTRHHRYRQLLLQIGFRSIRQVRGINWGSYGTTDIEFLANDRRADVHFSIGDTDLV